jgi:hypothetical protein
MKCRICGTTGLMNHTGATRSANAIDLALNVLGRWRTCENEHRWKTYEIDAAELADLRRRAYLFERLSAAETRHE